jgi:hypothetical protein
MDDLFKVMQYCDEVRFYDNENGFNSVALYKHNKFRIDGKRNPDWIIEMIVDFNRRNRNE